MPLSYNLELDFLRPVRSEPAECQVETVSSLNGALEAIMRLEAARLKLAHAFNKLASLSNSRTRLLPHQIEATYRVAQAASPRFLIADEVGLGKTIEAGLIIKELIIRRDYKRILIVVPATLSVQWQNELRSKFNEEFGLLSRATFQDFQPGARSARWITSVDFIKNPKYSQAVLSRRWDMVIFDEAHRLRRDLNVSTRAYAFAEAMSTRTEGLLLLSATPFRGKLEELFYLIRLIDPHLLGPQAAFINDYVLGNRDVSELKDRLARVMLRRRKKEVGGFTRRHAQTVRLELSPAERELYDETTEYVRREYNRAISSANRMTGLVMIAFQKLLDSSTNALLQALERRRQKLEQATFRPGGISSYPGDAKDEEELLEESIDARNHSTLQEMRQEILVIKRLIKLARAVKVDRKFQKLSELLARLKKQGYQKFVIFTQFKTTLESLQTGLTDYSVSIFHGSMSLREKEAAIENFRLRDEILICTEAGGEGRNLQFACILINYDLPWSPLKIEQRIGRVHRFGQKSDVLIVNFSTQDTVAERVLEVLQQKIRMFEESIGPSDALLGAVDDEDSLQKSIMDYVSGRKSRRELDSDLEEQARLASSGFARLNELVAPRLVDFNLEDYYKHTGQDRKIDNATLEDFVARYYRQFSREGFELRRLEKGTAVEWEIKNCSTGEARAATFQSDRALENDGLEFMALGHPAVDQALDYFLSVRQTTFVQTLRAPRGMAGLYYIFLAHYSQLSHAELIAVLVGPDQTPSVRAEILFPFGYEPRMMAHDSGQAVDYRRHLERAEKAALDFARKQALLLEDEKGQRFEKSKYELSFGKKIRLLEEKADRLKSALRFHDSVVSRSQLTRTENELRQARLEKGLALDRLERNSHTHVELDLFQIYHLI